MTILGEVGGVVVRLFQYLVFHFNWAGRFRLISSLDYRPGDLFEGCPLSSIWKSYLFESKFNKNSKNEEERKEIIKSKEVGQNLSKEKMTEILPFSDTI